MAKKKKEELIAEKIEEFVQKAALARVRFMSTTVKFVDGKPVFNEELSKAYGKGQEDILNIMAEIIQELGVDLENPDIEYVMKKGLSN